jgi:CubicO group peptidase (beta-lactamase class C family)
MTPKLRGRAALVLAIAGATACLPDADWKRRGETRPEDLDDGWEAASPESVGLEEGALEQIHEQLLREDAHLGALAFLVVKDGYLVFETYLRSDADRDHVHAIQSVTKSVTSMAFGIARSHGAFPSLDEPLEHILPEPFFDRHDDKRRITLEHLLTMRSGIDIDNDHFAVELLTDRPDDPLGYILDKPLFATPGEQFDYRDADPQLLGYALQHETRQREEDFVREHLFEPLGIEDYSWEAAPDGTTLAPFGLHLRPRDLAKLGQLLLESCGYGDGSVLPVEWCLEATRSHISPDEAGQGEPRGYGYYFWTLPEHDAFAAWGHGGQFILVAPAHDLVLVQVALPDAELHGSELMDFVQLTAPLYR